ncbi:hypothetical protein NL676_026900 [Syzygium grande]|nr:hypothetical protein NL676_026900 [Syzygium grande]
MTQRNPTPVVLSVIPPGFPGPVPGDTPNFGHPKIVPCSPCAAVLKKRRRAHGSNVGDRAIDRDSEIDGEIKARDRGSDAPEFTGFGRSIGIYESNTNDGDYRLGSLVPESPPDYTRSIVTRRFNLQE